MTSEEVMSVSSCVGMVDVRVSGDVECVGHGGNRGCAMSSDNRDASRDSTNTFCSSTTAYNACVYVCVESSSL